MTNFISKIKIQNRDCKTPEERVVVLVCGYNQRHYLQDCFAALRRQTQRPDQVFYLDNQSTDGSADFVEQAFPECVVWRMTGNLGFAAANNRGMERAFSEGAELCILLNSDTEADAGFIAAMVETYRQAAVGGGNPGLVQATVLLADSRDRINTTGNALHYLGYGFCRDWWKLHDASMPDREILSVSGAALLISRDYHEAVGGFDEAFFIYNEDQDLSWRGLLLGFRHRVSAKAIVYHKYTYREHAFKMYHSEKNRLSMLVKNYTTHTLVLLAPMLLVNEVLLLAHAAGKGWFGAKLRAYGYFLRNFRRLWADRREIAVRRRVDDAAIFRRMDSALEFHAYRGVLMRFAITPMMRGYYRMVHFWV